MKKFIAGMLIGMLLMTGVSYGNQLIAQVVNYTITVNGQQKQLTEKPVSINDRTYLPVRAVAEMLGYDVNFDETTQVISMSSKVVTPTKPIVVEGGKVESIKYLVYSIDGKYYNPSSLGGNITYDGNSLLANTFTIGEILSIVNGKYEVVATSDAGVDGQIINTKFDDYSVYDKATGAWNITNPSNGKVYSYTTDVFLISTKGKTSPLIVDMKAIFTELGISGSYQVNGDRLIISISK